MLDRAAVFDQAAVFDHVAMLDRAAVRAGISRETLKSGRRVPTWIP